MAAMTDEIDGYTICILGKNHIGLQRIMISKKDNSVVYDFIFDGSLEDAHDHACYVIKERLKSEKNEEAKIIDKVEQQVQHCLRTYENDLLEHKLVELVREWFFKGLNEGYKFKMGEGVVTEAKIGKD